MSPFGELVRAARRTGMLGGVVESLLLSRRRVPPIGDRDRARGLRYIELSEAVVRARIVGEGPRTVVLVPDPPNTIEHYDALVELLRPHARVVCFEAPGFGLSFPRSARFGFSPPEYAALVIELFERLGLRGVTLVFSCIGGYVGLMVARRRPALVEHLVLCQTPSHEDMMRWADRFDWLGLLGTPLIGQALMLLARDRATRSWYPAALPAGADAAPYVAPALAAQSLGGPYSLASAVQSMRRLDLAEIRGVTQRTTIAWGHADRTHAATSPRSLLRVVPHARFVSFDRCGHFPDLEDPHRFTELVLGEASAPG